MEDTDEFDDFLFDSIRQYDTLQMFNLENVPHHLLQLQDMSVCVVNQRDKLNSSEILKLLLPKKLVLPPDEEGRSKENDFKVLSGIYTESLVHSIHKLQFNNKIVTSELNIKGLKIYDLNAESIGSTAQPKVISVVPWKNPNFIPINSTNFLLCSNSILDPLLLIDFEVQKLVKEIKHEWLDSVVHQTDIQCQNNIMCKQLNYNSIVLLNSYSGDLAIHDLRTNNCIVNLPAPDSQYSLEKWVISVHDFCNLDFNYLGILSTRNNFYIFDSRKLNKLFEKFESNESAPNLQQLKMKFNKEENQFSISGFDSNINVFSLNKTDFKHLFKHIGHSPSNSENVRITDHIWLSFKHRELILSACDNKTLNCWQFNKNYFS